MRAFAPASAARPEIAPDLASWRGTSNTVSRALALIAEGALDGPENSVEKLAARLGLGERQLRRLFLQHLGASLSLSHKHAGAVRKTTDPRHPDDDEGRSPRPPASAA